MLGVLARTSGSEVRLATAARFLEAVPRGPFPGTKIAEQLHALATLEPEQGETLPPTFVAHEAPDGDSKRPRVDLGN